MAEPELFTAHAVLVGSFNPAIVHPAWLERHELLRKTELASAQVEVVVPDFARFSVAWAQFQVTTTHFQVSTSDPEAELLLRDLVVSIFSILGDTPIRAFGLNHDAHYRMRDEDAWHRVGNRLTPKDVWEDVMTTPGMRSLTLEDVRPDDSQGFIHVRFEPSYSIPYGLFVGVNDHYQVAPADAEFVDLVPAAAITNRVAEEWIDARERAATYADVALKLA
jgi:hypothetical protein